MWLTPMLGKIPQFFFLVISVASHVLEKSCFVWLWQAICYIRKKLCGCRRQALAVKKHRSRQIYFIHCYDTLIALSRTLVTADRRLKRPQSLRSLFRMTAILIGLDEQFSVIMHFQERFEKRRKKRHFGTYWSSLVEIYQ